MTVGLEIIGLVLAVFPVVVEVVDWYSGAIKGRDTQHLAVALKTNKQIFENAVERLLRCAVPAAQLQILLRDPGGAAWNDKAFNETVTERLGEEADSVFEKIGEIHKTILKLQEKLPSRDSATADHSLYVRAKSVMKYFVKGPHYKASLEKLKINVNDFRALTQDTIQLAPSRRGPPKPLRNLDLVQECASGLHEALQNRWRCKCDQLHPANIKLEVWSLHVGEADDGEGSAARLKFSFLFADDAERAHSDHWITAEITPIKADADEKGKLRDGTKRSIILKSGTAATSEGVSLKRSYTMPGESQGGSNDGSIGDAIDDLCVVFKNPKEHPHPVRRRRLGSISDSNGHSYHLFSKSDQVDAVDTRQSVKLADELFNPRTKLTKKARVQLALKLAWGVSQISSTSWLSGKWTKDNILLVADDPNHPLPYVSHRFQSFRRASQSSTLDPITSDQLASWIRNASLFALCVIMIEMCYSRSIEDLASDEEKNERGEATAHTPFLTASRKAKDIYAEMGISYGKAVNACLNLPDVDMDAVEKPEDPSQFAGSILKNIIEPLQACARFYESPAELEKSVG